MVIHNPPITQKRLHSVMQIWCRFQSPVPTITNNIYKSLWRLFGASKTVWCVMVIPLFYISYIAFTPYLLMRVWDMFRIVCVSTSIDFHLGVINKKKIKLIWTTMIEPYNIPQPTFAMYAGLQNAYRQMCAYGLWKSRLCVHLDCDFAFLP